MKKKTLKMAVAAMVVAAAGYGLYLNQNKTNVMSDLESWPMSKHWLLEKEI